MPSSYTIGSHFEAFVQAQLASGRYNNASEVLRGALRLVEERERRLAALDTVIARGLADIESGHVPQPERSSTPWTENIPAGGRTRRPVKVVLSEAARFGLEQIGDYIARDNPSRARSFIAELRTACLTLGEIPQAFPIAPRYERPGVRRRPHGQYSIYYRVDQGRVSIVQILHGAAIMRLYCFPTAKRCKSPGVHDIRRGPDHAPGRSPVGIERPGTLPVSPTAPARTALGNTDNLLHLLLQANDSVIAE